MPSDRSVKLGDFKCRALYDGSRSIGSMTKNPARRFIFGDAPEDEVESAVKWYGGLDSSTQIPFHYLLVEVGGGVALVDVGCGVQAENGKNPGEPAGLLLESLHSAGYDVGDVDTVVVSHCHWDHFGGAVSDGRATFPRAEYVLSRREAEHIEANAKGWAPEYMRVLGDRLRLVPDAAEICPGITVRVTPGHTPGITVTEITSRGETLLYTSDIILHRAHFEHPGWIPSFETDKVAAEASRRSLIEDAYRRKTRLFVPHISGVFGHVGKTRDGFIWVDG
jgi:glyoxylase-like metal-dependent hydrolase (beta-lactamase superfamily II)